MKQVVKKLEVVDIGQLQSLVIEHIDGIEPGLTVLDSKLLLGHASVDIVAVDAQGALVLVTAGFTADEDMLLKAVEAYSWCLEYPEAIRRLYPSVDVSAARPPRLMFVVDRLPDAFHRKIKQLGFSEVDCVEFRYLDVDGTQAAYFDTIARLRRGTGAAEFQPAPIARRVSDLSRRESDRPGERGDKVVPLVSAPNNARATSVRLQKMLNTTGHGNGAAPVIDLASRAAVPTPRVEPPAPRVEVAAPRAEVVRIDKAPRIETPSPRIETPAPEIELPRVEIVAPTIEIAMPEVEAPGAEIATPDVELAEAPSLRDPAPRTQPRISAEPVARVALREAIPVPAPVVAAAPAPQAAEPRVSFAEVSKELLGAPAGAPKPAPAIKPIAPAPTAAPAIRPIAPPPKPIAPAPQPIAPAPKPIAPAPKPVAPAPITAAPKPVVPAAKPAVAAPKPASAAPAAVTKPAVSDAKPATPETSGQNLPQEFDGLKFPNDGVLTRQWMEFLNQMASSK